jgi:hypothetical protein
MKKIVLSILFLMCALISLSGETVFLYIQNNVDKTDTRPVLILPRYLEEGVLDVFFDAGHIILSGTDVQMRIPRDAEPVSLRLARNDGAVLLLEVFIEFPEGELERESVPVSVSYQIILTDDTILLAEGKLDTRLEKTDKTYEELYKRLGIELANMALELWKAL